MAKGGIGQLSVVTGMAKSEDLAMAIIALIHGHGHLFGHVLPRLAMAMAIAMAMFY